MAAVEGRAAALGRGEKGRGGVYRKQWQTINRAYQEPAAESGGLMVPCHIYPEQAHTVCSACVCYEPVYAICVCVQMASRSSTGEQSLLLRWTRCLCLLGLASHSHDVTAADLLQFSGDYSRVDPGIGFLLTSSFH